MWFLLFGRVLHHGLRYRYGADRHAKRSVQDAGTRDKAECGTASCPRISAIDKASDIRTLILQVEKDGQRNDFVEASWVASPIGWVRFPARTSMIGGRDIVT